MERGRKKGKGRKGDRRKREKGGGEGEKREGRGEKKEGGEKRRE